MTLKETNCSDKMLLVHNGALGDFFMVWPSILALREALPKSELLWAGKPAMLRWVASLGISPGDPALHRGIRKLYGAGQWPAELAEIQVVWFGLSGPCPCPHEQILFLPGIDESRPDIPPRKMYREKLEAHGIAGVTDWKQKFQTMFRQPSSEPGSEILLFPGSGHPAKNWCLVKFLELAERLAEVGESPCFVLGPVEQELAMQCGTYRCHRPDNLGELEILLASARLVVGNDSGPMHLAGCLGVPGVALFGPTSHRQWGQPGIVPVLLNLNCRPCSATARISCARPLCMEIPVQTVFEKCMDLIRTRRHAGKK